VVLQSNRYHVRCGAFVIAQALIVGLLAAIQLISLRRHGRTA